MVPQILLHPYVYAKQAPTLALCAANGIIPEAYSALMCVYLLRIHSDETSVDHVRDPSPITHMPGGALDKPLAEISAKLNAKPEQVLLAWVKAKGAVVVTCVQDRISFPSLSSNRNS